MKCPHKPPIVNFVTFLSHIHVHLSLYLDVNQIKHFKKLIFECNIVELPFCLITKTELNVSYYFGLPKEMTIDYSIIKF
jgi:hypothetical protein